jgi:hypothetical protein
LDKRRILERLTKKFERIRFPCFILMKTFSIAGHMNDKFEKSVEIVTITGGVLSSESKYPQYIMTIPKGIQFEIKKT